MISDNVRTLRGPISERLPSSRRWHANWPAHLVWPGRRQPCTILNISGCGAKVSLDAFPDDVGQVRLVIDGLREISSDVVWRRDGEAGLRFHEVQQWVACLKAAADAPVEMRRVSADGKSGS